jgi:alkanesulfonate monooxygenase SsuD/methylene tetrahydromethanopterin reductase-like flavin-dependent oxidoreductase (luciferase family)
VTVRVGVTLPSFRDDPEDLIVIARAADAAGLDGVFAYDHLFRRDPARPALELTTVLGAVAAETAHVAVGTLVARVTLRPPRTLVAALDTVARVAGGRLIAALGTGDEESDPEMVAYGLPVHTMEQRIALLTEVLEAARGHGYPLWVAGASSAVWRAAAVLADGWNRWGGTPAQFAVQAARVGAALEAAGRDPGALTLSWGGLVAIDDTDTAVAARRASIGERPDVISGTPTEVATRLRAYADAGASWVIAGPLDSANVENIARLCEVRRLLNR